jgi:hypothetical protein
LSLFRSASRWLGVLSACVIALPFRGQCASRDKVLHAKARRIAASHRGNALGRRNLSGLTCNDSGGSHRRRLRSRGSI